MKFLLILLTMYVVSAVDSIEVINPQHVVEIKQKIRIPESENKTSEVGAPPRDNNASAVMNDTIKPTVASHDDLNSVLSSGIVAQSMKEKGNSLLNKVLHHVLKRSLEEDDENVGELNDQEIEKNSRTDAVKSLEKRILSLDAQKSMFERLYLEQLNLIKSFCK